MFPIMMRTMYILIKIFCDHMFSFFREMFSIRGFHWSTLYDITSFQDNDHTRDERNIYMYIHVEKSVTLSYDDAD